jgi:hypothetical protein
MNWITCPSCQSRLNAFHLAAPKSEAWTFSSPLRGVVECPNCHAHILQQPGGGFVTGVFALGGFALALTGISLDLTFERVLAILSLWTVGFAIWTLKRRWIVVPDQERGM